MDILRVVFAGVAVFMLVAAVSVIIKRRGEKRQNSMQLTYRQRRQLAKADRAMEYLVKNTLEHELITQRFESCRKEYAGYAVSGSSISYSLAAQLQFLYDSIETQIKDDIKATQTMAPDIRIRINNRHLAWDKIQQEIMQMLDN